jgi:hypothetical protein
MTDPHFERSLRGAARRGRPGGVHPDASLLAAYVDRGLSDAERATLEAHVADCPECMERLAMLGSVNVPEEPETPTLDWSPRRLLARWGWLVPVATVVVLVAVWERQPSTPPTFAPPPPSPSAPLEQTASPPASVLESAANERAPGSAQKGVPESPPVPARQEREASKAKDASVRPQLQAQARGGAAAAARAAPVGDAAEEFALRDKKETDALSPLQANKVAAAPATAAAKPAQTEAGASVGARADEAKPGNQPQAGAIAPMHEAVAGGTLLKSAVEAPAVIVSGPGVSIRRFGTRLERSTDSGATWSVDLVDAPTGLHAGSCPTATVCWLGGSQGIVLVRQPSGSWTRHVVADGRAAVTAIEAVDAVSATVRLSDGRGFHTTDGGATWGQTESRQ